MTATRERIRRILDLGLPIAIMLSFAAVMIGLSRLVPDRGALS